MPRTPFLCGVIEGFYGPPWTPAQRQRLLVWMRRWRLNTYFHAPKDDLKHRALWRMPYSPAELRDFKRLIQQARRAGVNFLFGLSPGVDMTFSDPREHLALRRKIDQLFHAGTRQFALLFDDIPPRLASVDRRRFHSAAAAHISTANTLFHWLRKRSPDTRLLFCPTPYCGRFAGDLRHCDYLREVGEKLHPAIDVFWTGPEIISETIPADSLERLAAVIRRKAVLWDNLHANDYDFHRLHLGPYSGRSPEVLPAVSGILLNPNCEFETNFVPLCTLAHFVRYRGRRPAAVAYRAALREWLPEWRAVSGEPFALTELEFVADCFHLPNQVGRRARRWLSALEILIAGAAGPRNGAWRCLKREHRTLNGQLMKKLPLLANRDLFHALYPRLTGLQEEMRFGIGTLDPSPGNRPGTPAPAPTHPPGVFRGGIVATLQRLFPLATTRKNASPHVVPEIRPHAPIRIPNPPGDTR